MRRDAPCRPFNMEPQGETKNARVVWFKPGTQVIGTVAPCGGVPSLVQPPTLPRNHPSLLSKAAHLKRDMVRWVKAGAKFTPRDARKARQAVCRGCDLWNPKGNWGLGECGHKSCGCTKGASYLATSRCPLGKWAA